MWAMSNLLCNLGSLGLHGASNPLVQKGWSNPSIHQLFALAISLLLHVRYCSVCASSSIIVTSLFKFCIKVFSSSVNVSGSGNLMSRLRILKWGFSFALSLPSLRGLPLLVALAFVREMVWGAGKVKVMWAGYIYCLPPRSSYCVLPNQVSLYIQASPAQLRCNNGLKDCTCVWVPFQGGPWSLDMWPC